MLKRTALILASLLLAFFHLAMCEDIAVSYCSGDCYVDVEGEGRWTKASVNMSLNTNSLIKTGKEGQAELIIHGESVAIGSETTIEVSSIVENLKARGRVGWFQKISRRFAFTSTSLEDKTESALLGVRGNLEGEGDVVWMEEHETFEQGLVEGKAQYDEGSYARAISIFKGLLYDKGADSSNGELSFYLGASLFNSVQYEEALPHLRDAIRDQEAYYREAALLYYSFSCYFTGQNERAIDGFITYVEEFEQGVMLPYALLMLGKSYKGTGDSQNAMLYFEEVEEHYSHTEAYDDAVQELGEFKPLR